MTNCYRCSTELKADTLWCTTCQCYQDIDCVTKPCERCGLFVPVSATNCLQCNEKVGFSFPISTINTLVALVGSTIAVLVGVFQFVVSDSATDLRFVGINPKDQQIDIRALNTGDLEAYFTEASFVYNVPNGDDLTEILVLKDSQSRLLKEGFTILSLVPNGGSWTLRTTLESVMDEVNTDIGQALFDTRNEIENDSVSNCRIQVVAEESDGEPAVLEQNVQENCNEYLRKAYKF